MSSEFNPDNTHSQNVKVAIDKIIGSSTKLRKKKKMGMDYKKRAVFNRIIHSIIEAEERSTVLEETFFVNLNRYDRIFLDIINDFFELYFTKEQIDVINFFLYDRYSPGGTVLNLVDNNNNIIKLDNVDDLWFLLKKMEDEPSKFRK